MLLVKKIFFIYLAISYNFSFFLSNIKILSIIKFSNQIHAYFLPSLRLKIHTYFDKVLGNPKNHIFMNRFYIFYLLNKNKLENEIFNICL